MNTVNNPASTSKRERSNMWLILVIAAFIVLAYAAYRSYQRSDTGYLATTTGDVTQTGETTGTVGTGGTTTTTPGGTATTPPATGTTNP